MKDTGPRPRVALGDRPAHDGPSLVSLRAVAVAIEHTPVLDSVDLALGEGQAVGVIGANGSGKSTLLQVCATLRTPHRGSGEVLGVDLGARMPAEVRRSICLVGHQPALYPRLTLRENLVFVADLYRRPRATVDRALGSVGLARVADRRLDRCSQGMARRADLARALITQPLLLLLDEAHSGLDAAASELVAHLISQVRARGGAALVASHEAERLDAVVDRLVLLTEGCLVPDERGS
jgi:ABC-type multidrug transport system ATPase subunit